VFIIYGIYKSDWLDFFFFLRGGGSSMLYNIHMYVYLSLHHFFQSGSGNRNFSRLLTTRIGTICFITAYAAKQYNHSALAALICIIETCCNCAAPYHKPLQKTCTAYQRKAVQPQRIGSPNLHNWNVLQLCCSLPQANTKTCVLRISICWKAVQPQHIGSPNLHNWNVLQLCCSLQWTNTEERYCISAYAAKQYFSSALAAVIYIIETCCNCAARYQKVI
jgi:hypothetical protein